MALQGPAPQIVCHFVCSPARLIWDKAAHDPRGTRWDRLIAVGIALGFIFQRGRFCVTGAFRDLTLTRNTRWFSALIVLIAVHSIGIAALTQLGVITPEVSPFPWLASIVGGLIFGYSIVFAGGCAIGLSPWVLSGPPRTATR